MLLNNIFFQQHSIFVIWPLYCLICIPLAYIILLIVPFSMRHRPMPVFALFYLLSISIFLVGILISIILATLWFYQKPVSKKKPFWFSVDYPDYQRPPSTDFLIYGEGAGFKIIRSPKSSTTSREKVLVAVNQFEARNVSKINELALTDELEEVRLYAQSLMEKQERKFSKHIKKFTLALGSSENEIAEAHYKKQISEVLWEQVYNYLVLNENLKATLNNIRTYATEAQAVLSDDIELPLVLAKVSIHLSDIRAAKNWLRIAAENEAPEYKVYSILAELEYNEKNYSAIKNVLIPCVNKEIIGLEPIIKFWVAND